MACHVYHCGAALNTSVMLRVALTSLAPSAARPGVPAGTSGGGRQNVIVLFAIDESGIVSGTSSTYAGTCRVCPAAARFSSQYAPCVAVPVHAVARVLSGTVAPANETVVVGAAAVMLPFSWSGELARSAAMAVPETVPTTSPSGWASSAA